MSIEMLVTIFIGIITLLLSIISYSYLGFFKRFENMESAISALVTENQLTEVYAKQIIKEADRLEKRVKELEDDIEKIIEARSSFYKEYGQSLEALKRNIR